MSEICKKNRSVYFWNSFPTIETTSWESFSNALFKEIPIVLFVLSKQPYQHISDLKITIWFISRTISCFSYTLCTESESQYQVRLSVNADSKAVDSLDKEST